MSDTKWSQILAIMIICKKNMVPKIENCSENQKR